MYFFVFGKISERGFFSPLRVIYSDTNARRTDMCNILSEKMLAEKEYLKCLCSDFLSILQNLINVLICRGWKSVWDRVVVVCDL